MGEYHENFSTEVCSCVGGREVCQCVDPTSNTMNTVALIHSVVMLFFVGVLFCLTRQFSALLSIEGVLGKTPPHKGPFAGVPVVTGQVPRLVFDNKDSR